MRYIRQNEILVKKKNHLLKDFTRRVVNTGRKSRSPRAALASRWIMRAPITNLLPAPTLAATPLLSIQTQAVGFAVCFRRFSRAPLPRLCPFGILPVRPLPQSRTYLRAIASGQNNLGML